MKPKKVSRGLLVQELPMETIVYDKDQQKGYCISQVSAAVFRYCNGKNSVRVISSRVSAELKTPIPEHLVMASLAELSRAGLLQNNVKVPSSRRSMISAMFAIAVTVLVAPKKGRGGRPQALPEESGGLCGDGIDNDHDGAIDCADPGCSDVCGS